ncbi:ThuA domain-containing protein [Solirubrobacter pauli]|nr:ThuA domain-containing protein [Solirubrobacter pauli]
MGLALLTPSTAAASAKAAPADPYKVLVVTSANDDLSAAGIAAIKNAAGGDFSVTAPAPADVGGQFTAAGLDAYRAVVFLDTGQASPLTDAQRAAFEGYFKKGGGFVGVGSAVETDPSWSFLDNLLGTRASGRTEVQTGTVKVFDRVHDASKNLPEYWDRKDAFYNFKKDVRGLSHVLASVVEDPFGPQPQGQVLDGIAGGTMGANHPISFCKDYLGGRAFYTGLGNTPESFDAGLTTHLKGAIAWAAGQSSPVYSDCGATVRANYQETKISAPPNLAEPVSFDQLPDGRIIQTARQGTVRLHDPVKGTTTVLADFASASLPSTMRIYTNQEDGLYGGAVDNDFATNHWVYLYYSPQTVTNVKLSTGDVVTQTTPNTNAPNAAASPTAWDPYVGYFQLSRFKLVDDGVNAPSLDLNSEQQILRVSNNRQECCHVAGDIDFDKHNNLWITTGDDTPAPGIDANGYGPFEDQLLDEQQTVRVTNATGGTFTLTFNGQTTEPLAYNATAAQVDAALEALSNVGANNIQTSGGPVNTGNVNVFFRRALQQSDQAQITASGTALTGNAPTVATTTAQVGGWYQRPTGDDRRSTLNSNDLRGKLLRIHVKDSIGATDANKADLGGGAGAYTVPSGNLFPLVGGAPQDRTRPEIYAMGFRNPFRLQVDENDVAYVTDYSPDAQTPQRGRGPSGTGRMEIVRKPANYGYPLCYKHDLGYYRWNFREFAPGTTSLGTPLDSTPTPIDCGADKLINDSRWVRDGGPSFEPGLRELPPVTDPEIWYSYRDNNTTQPLGTPCAAYYAPTPGPIAPGSTTECPRLFPELYTGGVGPHGAVKYHFDASNPATKKFPAYYDNSVFLGEYTQDTLREIKLDAQNRILKINSLLDCGQANIANPAFDMECDNPMDIQFGKDGSLYLMTYGDSYYAANPDAGLYRFDYVKGQRAPKAVLSTDKTDGALPLTVQFTGSGSSDADPGDSIRYEWDFGDGSPISEEANPSHVYTKAGRYNAVLTVYDSSGQKTATSTIITAGNTAPTVQVIAPIAGGLFTFGDTIQYKVVVTDPDEPSIDCKDVQVTFVLGHDSHGHGEQTGNGCTGFLQTIAADVSHGGNVFGIISAQYADKGGSGGAAPSLTGYGQNQIRQKHTEVEFVLNQAGTSTASNTDGGAGVHRSGIGATDWLQLNGPINLQQIDKVDFRYADAAAGRTAGSPLVAIDLRQDSITGPVIATANLTSTGGTGTWATTSVPLANVNAGAHELFLTFRTVTGGATGNNLFNLNWLEFGGNGVTVQSTSTTGDAGGTVASTLSLTLGAPATLGPFVPGVAKPYTGSTTANVISTAGEATLSVADPSATATGHLVNGAFALPAALQVKAASPLGTGGAFADVGGASAPTAVLTYGAPVTNDSATVTFQQQIGEKDALRTGSYSKALTFTLSTTTP